MNNDILGSVLQSLWFVFLFAIILYVTFLFTKWISKLQRKKYRSNNIQIIESVNIAPQKTLQIIKIGEQYILLGLTKDRILHLLEMNESSININEDDKILADNIVPFQKYLDKFISRHNIYQKIKSKDDKKDEDSNE